jgi:hypothetical protein
VNATIPHAKSAKAAQEVNFRLARRSYEGRTFLHTRKYRPEPGLCDLGGLCVRFMIFRGTVFRKGYARGSKSEHEAICFRTGQDEYILRRRGGNAFSDPVLDELVGKEIQANGEVVGHTLLLDAWSEHKAT